MTVKISDAEFPIMEYIWDNHPVLAQEIAKFALESFGWKKNTTYTVIKRLVERGAIKRTDPGIVIEPLVTREQVQQAETDELIDKIYNGSVKNFFVSFLKRENISQEKLDEIKKLLEDNTQD